MSGMSVEEYRALVGEPEPGPAEMSADEYRAFLAAVGLKPLAPVKAAASQPAKKRKKEPCPRCGKGRCECLEVRMIAQLAAAGLPEPVREHRFHGTRMWRFDLAWLDRRIALEVDGRAPVPGGGHHGSVEGYEGEAMKYNNAALLGWRVFRVTGKMVRDGRALALMKEVLA